MQKQNKPKLNVNELPETDTPQNDKIDLHNQTGFVIEFGNVVFNNLLNDDFLAVDNYY